MALHCRSLCKMQQRLRIHTSFLTPWPWQSPGTICAPGLQQSRVRKAAEAAEESEALCNSPPSDVHDFFSRARSIRFEGVYSSYVEVYRNSTFSSRVGSKTIISLPCHCSDLSSCYMLSSKSGVSYTAPTTVQFLLELVFFRNPYFDARGRSTGGLLESN